MSDSANTDTTALHYLRQRRFARECALQFLYRTDLNGEWRLDAADVLRFWDQVQEEEDAAFGADFDQARGFASRLIEGVMSNREMLDGLISSAAANWELHRMGAVDRNILRIAAFEIEKCDDVPPVAAVNEALEIAKRFGDRESSRFVNGVLDRLLQDKRGAPAAES